MSVKSFGVNQRQIVLRRHRKNSLAGSIHFLTTVTNERGKWFVRPSVCQGMLEFLETARARLGVICLGYCLMPDHMHALVQQTADGDQISELMRYFKRETSEKYRPELYAADTLWHRRFDDVPVPGSIAVLTKLNYLHNNPVKKKLSETPEAYPWSSARVYAGMGGGVVTVETKLVSFAMI